MQHRSERTGLFIGKSGPHDPNPEIPRPERKEIAVTEELVHPHNLQHSRPKMIKPREEVIIPHFNHVYGTLRDSGGWRYVIDNYASGTVTDIAGAQATATVTLKAVPNWRLSQWPGGTNLYYCIRQFSIAAQQPALAVTAGLIDVYYQDLLSGYSIPLGDFLSNGASTNSLDTIIPIAVADPGLQTIGQLEFNLAGGATVTTLNWQIAFSGAYLLPNIEGNDLKLRGGPQHEAHLYPIHN
jgi:hypothetical protein